MADEGKILCRTIIRACVARIHAFNMENVPGIMQHAHYAKVIRDIAAMGFQLITATCDKVFPLLPVFRNRWLATFVRVDVTVSRRGIAKAKSTTLPSDVPKLGRTNCMADFGGIQTELHEWERAQCIPDEHMNEILSDPRFLPLSLRNEGFMLLTGPEVMKLRLCRPTQVLPHLMASYGHQHKLPERLLLEKGVYAFLIDVDDQPRMITPCEAATCMGMPDSIMLPTDFKQAWKVIGNSLTIPQAMLQCLRMHWILGEGSPFDDRIQGVFDICASVLETHIKLPDFCVVRDGEWMFLFKKQVAPFVQSHVLSTKHDSDDESDFDEFDPGAERVSKKPRIDPTWQFSIQAENSPNEPDDGQDVSSAGWSVDPATITSGDLDVERCTNMCPPRDGMMTIRLIHSNGIWALCFHHASCQSIREAFQLVLPHAQAEHFEKIFLNGNLVTCSSKPVGIDEWNVVFRTKTIFRNVTMDFRSRVLSVGVDVIWKIHDLRACIAAQAPVLSSSISFTCKDQDFDDDHYVLAVRDTQFFVTLEPIIIAEAAEDSRPIMKVPSIGQHPSPVEIPNSDVVRLTVESKGWSTIRTSPFNPNTSIGDALVALLPHLDCEHLPCVMVGGVPVDGESLVSQLPTQGVALRYSNGDGHDDFPVVIHHGAKFDLNTNDQTLVKNFMVKGPFDARSKICALPTYMTVSQIAAGCLLLAKAPCTLMVLQNGKMINSQLTLAEIDAAVTLDIRACPLVGGTKKDEATNAKLRQMLLNRGVDEPAIDARIALINSKIPKSELATIVSQEESAAWGALKKRANEAKLRMITNQELKQFQKTQRLKAGSSKDVRKEKPKQIVPKQDNRQVTVDPCHFKGNGVPMKAIDLSQWGPDKSGVVFVNPAQAEKLMPISRLSADPLALLVLTNQPFHSKQPIAVPAINQNGQPVLTSIVIIDFGDVPVTFHPNIPRGELKEIKTAILEITILRSAVPKWGETVNPCNYLGRHLPEIRNCKVISSWSFFPYDDARRKCAHEQAKYLHGFVKVAEDQLDNTLTRSGTAGIYMTVKGVDKKLDPRFGVVPMHGTSLEDILRMAKTIPKVLGVVMAGREQTLALRGRREHIAEIRCRALPESLTHQQGDIPAGADWYYIKNVRASTGCNELSEALQSLGWRANAIKPTNPTTWLACSLDSPPASHLCLGDDYVAVVPVKRNATKMNDVQTVQATAVHFVGPDDVELESSTASRLSNLSTDIEERIQEKITTLVQDKLNACDAKINTLASSFNTLQQDVVKVAQVADGTQTSVQALTGSLGTLQQDVVKVANLADETKGSVQMLSEQNQSIHKQIETSNNNMMQQMQQLFANMQNELKSVKDSIPADPKRHKADNKDGKTSA
eukprot:Skav200945  [mRNA]  locus=scaffold2354:77239:81345:- [translate_table: standard]